MDSDRAASSGAPRRKSYKLPSEERLMRAALGYLDRYASTSENLRRVLARKVARASYALERDPAEFEPLIEAVVTRCTVSGLIDDSAYAETRVASLRRRGASASQIEAKLLSKGVARALVDKVLAEDAVEDAQACRRLAQRRRLGPWRTRGARADFRERDMAALCRAGFSPGLARRVIDGEKDDG